MRSGVAKTPGPPIEEVNICFRNRPGLVEIPVRVKTTELTAIIDTGAQVSLISRSAFGKTKVPEDTEKPNFNLRMANGEVAAVTCQVTTSLRIGTESYPLRLYVVETFPRDVILGLDFILRSDVKILTGSGEIWIGPSKFDLPKDEPGGARIFRSKKDVRIEPNSEVAMVLSGDQSVGTFLVEGSDFAEKMGLFVGATLTATTHGPFVGRVANPTGAAIIVKRGMPIAVAEEVVKEASDHANIFHATQEKLYEDAEGAEDSDNIGDPKKVEVEDLDIGPKLDESQRQRLLELIREFEDIVSQSETDTGLTDLLEHEIDTEGAAPVHSRPYRLSFSERREVSTKIAEYLDAGFIRESSSPWACPIVLVRKKDGSMRFCCDWRKLNQVTKKDAMPLPRINDMIDRLSKARFFTKLDFTSGFYQVPLASDAVEKTAFVTPDGHYEWLVMGMGLTNAPATFQRLMHRMLGSLLWTTSMAYMDDLVVYSEDFDSHLVALREVFGRIREAKLKVKPSKCSWAKDGIHYLGHVISSDGVRCDPANTRKVAEFVEPKTRKDVRSFLGLTSYYRRFIPKYAFVAKPLHDLTKESVKFEFDAKCSEAFEELKKALVEPPVLAFPDFEKEFIVTTDASGLGIGCVLKQMDPKGHERVIAYASRVLRPEEQRYSTTERECLALRYATIVFRPYLFGKKFRVITDHQSLRYLKSMKTPNGRLQRWNMEMLDFDFDVEYKQGKANRDADTLSRYGFGNGEC